eukprot:s2037_g6.t1
MDASAGIAMGSRRGLGKAKHVDTQYHWVQDRVAKRYFRLKKVDTGDMLADVINALISMGCEDRLMYLNNQLVVQQKYLSRLSSGQHPGTMGQAKAKTAAYDVLVIPLEGWLNSQRLEQLCVDLVLAVQALVTEMGASVLRVILLSSLSIGPGSATYRRDAVNRSAAAVGVVRSARAELPQVPMLWLDTDAEDGKTFQEQMMSEVDLALPPGGWR